MVLRLGVCEKCLLEHVPTAVSSEDTKIHGGRYAYGAVRSEDEDTVEDTDAVRSEEMKIRRRYESTVEDTVILKIRSKIQ